MKTRSGLVIISVALMAACAGVEDATNNYDGTSIISESSGDGSGSFSLVSDTDDAGAVLMGADLALSAPNNITGNTGGARGVSSSLRNLILQLKECQPKLLAARSDKETAQLSAEAVRLDRLPTFSVNGGGFVTDGDSDELSTSVTVTQPIATFGRQKVKEQVSLVEAELADAEYIALLSTHGRELVGLWRSRTLNKQKILIFETALRAKSDFLEVVERRAEQGVSSGAELSEVRSEYASDFTEIQNLRLVAVDLNVEISSLTCPNTDIKEVKLNSMPVTKVDLQLESHPDFRKENAQTKLAAEELVIANVADYPTLNLQGEANAEESRPSKLGLAFNYDYSSFGRKSTNTVDKAKLNLQRAQDNLRSRKLEIVSRNESDFSKAALLRKSVIPAIEAELANFENILKSSRRLYEAGRISVGEVLTNINSIKQTKIELSEAKYELSEVFNRLAYAAGKYSWQ